MKYYTKSLLYIFIFLFSISLGYAETPDSVRSVEICKKIVGLMNEQKFQEVYDQFNDRMKSAIGIDKISTTWLQVLTQTGGFESFGDIDYVLTGGLSRVKIDLKFKVVVLQATFALDSAEKVAGFFIAPKNNAVYHKPDYIDDTKYTEIPVKFGKPPFILPAMLTVPTNGKNFPVVIMVSGSGPNDMDETLGPNKPFKDIADGLATLGIATLRFDKRTKAYKELSIQMQDSVDLNFEYTIDVAAAFDYVKQELAPKYKLNSKNILILGHSLGGTMIPRFAEKLPGAKGFIIMAGMTVPFEQALLNQYEYIFKLDGKLDETEKANLDELSAKVKNMLSSDLSVKTPNDSLPLGLPASYWLDFRSYDPAKDAHKIKKPVLVLQGGRDYQVTMEDFQGWKQGLSGNKNATFKLYDDANHIFVSGNEKSTPSDYTHSGNVSKIVIDDIAKWILNLP